MKMYFKTPFFWSLVLLCFSLFTVNSSAQISDVDFDFGPVFDKKVDKTYFSQFIGENENGIYAIRKNGSFGRYQTYGKSSLKAERVSIKSSFGYHSDIYISRFDSDLSPAEISPLKYTGILESIFMLKGKLIMITSEIEESGKGYLYGHVLNDKTYTVEKRTKLKEVSIKSSKGLLKLSSSTNAKFRIKVLEDEGIFVVFTENQTVGGFLFKFDFISNEKGRAFGADLETYRGTVDYYERNYMFIQKREANQKAKRFDPNEKVVYQLFNYGIENYGSDKPIDIELDKHIVDIIVKERGGKVYISGLCTTNDPHWDTGHSYSEIEAFNGIYTICYDLKSRSVDYSEIKPFSQSFMTKVMGEKALKKMRKHGPGISNLNLMDMEFKSDGGFYIIGELRYREETRMSKMSDSNSTFYDYHYEDIVIASFDSDGNVEWMKSIKKNQKLKVDEQHYGSFIGVQSEEDNLYFIYNDLADNKNLAPDEPASEMTISKKRVLFKVHVDTNGKVKKSILHDNPDNYGVSMGIKTDMTEENSVILFSGKYSNQRLARVHFN